jgi:hypothetical protein
MNLSESVSSSAALRISRQVLRVLVVVNWLYGAGILTLLVIAFVNGPWLIEAFKMSRSPEPETVLMGFRAVAVLGLVIVPLHYIILRRLLAIIDTVRAGDPFVGANARRLEAIAWVLLALNIVSIVIGAIGSAISTTTYPVNLDAGFSLNGWIAVLLTFVLARVFAVGSLMREEIEATI